MTDPNGLGPPGVDRAGLPYTVLSCSMSMDGYIGGPTGERLILSNDADLDRVDAVRAGCDAIMVGAGTIRLDNPRLVVRSALRRQLRCARGETPTPMKVTVTGGTGVDPCAAFFTTEGEKVVYCSSGCAAAVRAGLGGAATVVGLRPPVTMRGVAQDLARRGVRRLMVEGGGTMHTQFLAHDLGDELRLAVAPVLVGDTHARRFVGPGSFPWQPPRRGRLAGVQQLGDVAVLTYALSERFCSHWIERADETGAPRARPADGAGGVAR